MTTSYDEYMNKEFDDLALDELMDDIEHKLTQIKTPTNDYHLTDADRTFLKFYLTLVLEDKPWREIIPEKISKKT
jgi:hypothetical protein